MGRFFTFVLVFFIALQGFAQIAANINSGNPAYPFPQFEDYGPNRKTLASVNPVGVPHAELERRTRDAWQMMCNNLAPTGDVVDGVEYLIPNAPTFCDCIEGYAYYLLGAAYMADKEAFDGLYMFIHDNSIHGRRRFIDGNFNTPGYLYSKGLSGAGKFGSPTGVLGGSTGGGQNSATDGDVDMGLALLVAYKQWGENSGIFLSAPGFGGKELNYKEEAMSYIKAMVDTVANYTIVPPEYGSGIVGLDGYVKGGDTWVEMTNWATGGYTSGGKTMIPEFDGPADQHIDYFAPAYFNSFRKWLDAEGERQWLIDQYWRAEASSDWLMGQMYNQGLIAMAGWVEVPPSNVPVYKNFMGGEDFRTAWRNILNYVWHGDPNYSWNPVTHEVDMGVPNTFEKDIGIQHASYSKEPQAAPWGNPCMAPGSSPITFKGTSTLLNYNSPDGTAMSEFPLNWGHGVGAPAAIAAQDFDLMAEHFRHCVIEWDAMGDPPGSQLYLDSRPRYFHEFFRWLGMHILTGNHQDPMKMNPSANMKIYSEVDKTFAFEGDLVTYTYSYRNYGSLDALNVLIKDTIPAGYDFVSATGGGAVNGNAVEWNIGTVTGFQTGGLAATTGTVSVTYRVNESAADRICNTVAIETSNGSGWISNEYPNNDTEVMERNCVDIQTEKPLSIKKEASLAEANPQGLGFDSIAYTVTVKNNSVGFLNGGRPDVQIGYANEEVTTAILRFKFRFYHDAHEPYINYGNYRVSYFMDKAGPPTWTYSTVSNDGFGGLAPNLSQQNLTPGTGYNHRIFLQFPDTFATITSFLYNYNAGSVTTGGSDIHEGATVPPRLIVDIHDAAYNNYDWTVDWSYNPAAVDADGNAYYPVTNDWTDPNNPNIAVNKLLKTQCEPPFATTINNVLVEEWDGYTWRRVYGDAPVSGRTLSNVQVTDYLPDGVTFGGFISGPSGTVSGDSIVFPTAELLIDDSITYEYWVRVRPEAYFGACDIDTMLHNVAKATATNEPAVFDTASTRVTCDEIIIPPAPTTMSKESDKTTIYEQGDPITYNIKYVQTHGTISEPDLNSNTNWTTVDAPAMTFGGGVLSTVNGSGITTHDRAHGSYGTIDFTAEPVQYATFGVAFHQDGAGFANGKYLTFKVEFSTLVITYWDGTTNVASVSPGFAAFGITAGAGVSPFDVSIELNRATNNLTVRINGTLVHTFGGIAAGTGYVGFINGDPSGADNFASHDISDVSFHWDSGFELEIVDPLPPEIGFTSASGSGTLVSDTVKWYIGAGPILYGDTTEVSFTGTVDSCSGITLSIMNTAYAQLFGQPDFSIGAMDTIGCSPPLSADILFFDAKAKGNDVEINWNIAVDGTNAQLVLLKSDNGFNFNEIYRNNAYHEKSNFLDLNTLFKDQYYQLRLSADGIPDKYSEKVLVKNSNGHNITVYPNPTVNNFTILVEGFNSDVSYQVMDMSGRLILNGSVNRKDNSADFGAELESGSYLIRLKGDDYVDLIKIIKTE